MKRLSWGLVLAGLLSRVGIAADAVSPLPAPELVRFDQELTGALEEKDRAAPEKFREFSIRFRANLDAAMKRLPRSPANAALHARILARLEEREAAELDQALQREPDGIERRLARGQTSLDEGDYPAALAEANAILERDPRNKAALALKYSSTGRMTSKSAGVADAVSPKPAMAASASEAPSPVTASELKRRASAPPPDIVSEGDIPAPGRSSPLLPLAGASGLGLLAYGVYRSKSSYESSEGFDEEHRPPYGPGQRFVAGAVLAGLAGAGIYLAGAAMLSLAPAALHRTASIGNQGLRLAQSEVGAINPGSREAAKNMGQAAAIEVERVVIKKGEILNRVWHSDWEAGAKTLSGPEGLSYCRGSCLPINAARAVEGRGLTVGVVNNARKGGLYRVTEDIVVTVRRSIGGYDEEILLQSRADINKLELMGDTISSIPPGVRR